MKEKLKVLLFIFVLLTGISLTVFSVVALKYSLMQSLSDNINMSGIQLKEIASKQGTDSDVYIKKLNEYNLEIKTFNMMIETFPNNYIAKLSKFKKFDTKER